MSDASAGGPGSSAFAHLGAGHVLVFQHLTSETPGMVGEHLVAAGFEMTTVELDVGEPIPDLEPFDALVVMGGPMDVWEQEQLPWLIEEKAAIRRWVAMERPYLGVCLGHQLLADALGGRVGKMKSPEVGVLGVELLPAGRIDPLLGMLPERLPALQWHHAEVVAPPAGAEVLATSTRCALQAFRVGHWAWGLQFHIEADVHVVEEWSEVPAYRAALSASGDGDPDWLTRAVEDNAATMRSACRSLSTALVWVIDKSRTARSWAGLPPEFDRDLEARGAHP